MNRHEMRMIENHGFCDIEDCATCEAEQEEQEIGFEAVRSGHCGNCFEALVHVPWSETKECIRC